MSGKRLNFPDNMGDLFHGMEDLSLEQAEELLLGIDKVTICPSERAVIEKKVLRKVIAEAGERMEEEGRIQIGKQKGWERHFKNRKYMKRAVICIAAIMACSVVAIAAANINALQRFWGDDTRIYGTRALETVQSVKNENVKVNIEGIVSDKYQCVFVVSMEALTKEGQRIIRAANKDISSKLKIEPIALEGGEFKGTRGIFQYTEDNKDKDYKAYRCDFELEKTDLTKPVTVDFDGLTMKFNIPEYMQVMTLYPESEAGIESVELSPIGYYYKASELAEEVILIKKDGSLDKELGYHGSMVQQDNEEVMAIGSFTELLDLKEYMGIQIDGIKYTVK